MWKSKNNIRLKSQIGLQLWKNSDDDYGGGGSNDDDDDDDDVDISR